MRFTFIQQMHLNSDRLGVIPDDIEAADVYAAAEAVPRELKNPKNARKIRGESSRQFMQKPRLLGIGQRVPTVDGHLRNHRGVSTRKVRTALLRGIFINGGREGKGDAAEGEDKGLLGGVVFGRTSGAEGLVNLIARWTGLGGTKYHSTTKNRIMYIFRQ